MCFLSDCGWVFTKPSEGELLEFSPQRGIYMPAQGIALGGGILIQTVSPERAILPSVSFQFVSPFQGLVYSPQSPRALPLGWHVDALSGRMIGDC